MSVAVEEVKDGEPAAPKRRSLLHKTLATAVTLAIVGVGLAWLFAAVFPQDFRNEEKNYIRLAMAVFFFDVARLHVAVGLFVVALLALLVRVRRRAAVAAVMGAILIAPYARHFFPKSPPPSTGPTIRVMSVNVFVNNTDASKFVAEVRRQRPDVIAIVEANGAVMRAIRTELKGDYPYMHHPAWVPSTAVLISRLPVKVGDSPLTPGKVGARTPMIVNIDGVDVSIYGVHFVSPGGVFLTTRNRYQIRQLVRVIEAETRPTIVCGDFNVTFTTANYGLMRQAGMRSSFELAGRGLGATWRPIWSAFRPVVQMQIDHILLSPQLTATNHFVGNDIGSDHLPIFADVGIARSTD